MSGLSARVDNAAGAQRWLREFEDTTIVVQRVRNPPRAEAERAAYEIVLVEFLNETHPDTDPNRCAHCGKIGTPDAFLLPIGWGDRNAWLHQRCWVPWRERRWTGVIAALAAMGISEPARRPSSLCRNRSTPTR